jgi:7-carboxy-7-deazaguanine synthase
MLRVTEIFKSIQGESTHAGCPMRCVWCDSEYTFTGGDHISIESILEQVRAFGGNLVEVTGGEPLAQKEGFTLIKQLCDEGYEVLVETGGYVSTADVDPRAKVILDVKCPTSGEEARNHWPNLDHLRADKDEVKFVVANQDDWEYARELIERLELSKRAKAILISPAWDAIDLQELAESIVASGLDVRMQLQLHKYIWGPEVHGV